MIFFTPPNRFTAASIFRAGLFVLFLIGLFQPVALKADPIVFQATTLTSSACGATVAGDNFSFDGTINYGACTGRLAPVGIPDWPLPGQQGYYTPLATGYLTAPGFPERLAVAYGGGQPSLYKDVTPTYLPESFTGIVAVNVVLSGIVQVCLADEQPGSQVVSSCDPAYLDFAVININVAGQAMYFASDGGIGARNMEYFTATSAAASEPSKLSLVGGATLLVWVVVAQKKWRGYSNV